MHFCRVKSQKKGRVELVPKETAERQINEQSLPPPPPLSLAIWQLFPHRHNHCCHRHRHNDDDDDDEADKVVCNEQQRLCRGKPVAVAVVVVDVGNCYCRCRGFTLLIGFDCRLQKWRPPVLSNIKRPHSSTNNSVMGGDSASSYVFP